MHRWRTISAAFECAAWSRASIPRHSGRRGKADSGTSVGSHLFDGIRFQPDVFVKRRPLMEGLLRTSFSATIELTLAHGVQGTSVEAVSATLDSAARRLADRAAHTDPGASLVQLLRQSVAACEESTNYAVTELLEELDCTARLDFGDAQPANGLRGGYSGAVYLVDAWQSDARERCVVKVSAGQHETFQSLVSALAQALKAHLLAQRGAHVRAAVREVQTRLTETDCLRHVDPVFAAAVPLTRTPRSRQEPVARQSQARLSVLHHQPTSQALCALFEVRDAQGLHASANVPLLSLRSRRDYVYTPHAPYPFLTVDRLSELVENGATDGTVVEDQWSAVPHKEVVWWAFTLLARASPLYAFGLSSASTAGGRSTTARTDGLRSFLHGPLSIEALVRSEGRLSLVSWQAAKWAVCVAHAAASASSLTRLTALEQSAVESRHALHHRIGEEVGWRHAPLVQLGTVRWDRPRVVSFPSVVATHARGGTCHTVACVFTSAGRALAELFPPSFADRVAQGSPVSTVARRRSKASQEEDEEDATGGEEQEGPHRSAGTTPAVAASLAAAESVQVRLPSLYAVLRARGVVSARYAHGTLSCRNAAGTDVVVFRDLMSVEGYAKLLEFAHKAATQLQQQQQQQQHQQSCPDDSSSPACMRTVTLPAGTRNAQTQLVRLLLGVMMPTTDAASEGEAAAWRPPPTLLPHELRLPLPLNDHVYVRLRLHTRTERDIAMRRLLSLLQHFSPDGRQWPLPTPPFTTFFDYWPVTRVVLKNLEQNYVAFRYTITAGTFAGETDAGASLSDPCTRDASAVRRAAFTAVFYHRESEELARVALPNDARALELFYDQCRALAQMNMADKTLLEVVPGFVLPHNRIAGGSPMTYQSLVRALFRHNELYALRDASKSGEPHEDAGNTHATAVLNVQLTPDCVVTLAHTAVRDDSAQWKEDLARQFVETHLGSLVPVLEAHNTVSRVAAVLDVTQGATVGRAHVCLLTDHRGGGVRQTSTEGDVAPSSLSSEPWCEAVLVSRSVSGASDAVQDVAQVLAAVGANRGDALMALAHKAQHLRQAIAVFQEEAAPRRGMPLLARLQQRVGHQLQLRHVRHRHDSTVVPSQLILVGDATPSAERHGTPREVVIATMACAWPDLPRTLFSLYQHALSLPRTTSTETPSPKSLFASFDGIHSVLHLPTAQLVQGLAVALQKSTADVHSLYKGMAVSSSVRNRMVQSFGQLALPAELFECAVPADGAALTLYTAGHSVREAQRGALVALYVWIVCGIDQSVPNVQTVPFADAGAGSGSPNADSSKLARRPSEPPLRMPTPSAPVRSSEPDAARALVVSTPSPVTGAACQSLLSSLLADLEAKLCALDPLHSASSAHRGRLSLRLTHVFGASLSYTVAGASASQPRAASPRVKVRHAATKSAKPIPLGAQAWDPAQLHLVQILELVATTDAKITASMSEGAGAAASALHLPRTTVAGWWPLNGATAMEFCLSFFRRYLGLPLHRSDSPAGTPGQLCLAYDITRRAHEYGAETHTVRLRLQQFGETSVNEGRVAFSLSVCEVVGATREAALAKLWSECAGDIRRAFQLRRGASQGEVDAAVLLVANIALE